MLPRDIEDVNVMNCSSQHNTWVSVMDKLEYSEKNTGLGIKIHVHRTLSPAGYPLFSSSNKLD